MTAMSALMENLLDEAGHDDDEHGRVLECQIEFKGLSLPTPAGDPNMTAGVLRRGPVDGIFVIGSPTQATASTPNAAPGEVVLIEQFFEASEVRRVIRAMPTSGIVLSPGIQ